MKQLLANIFKVGIHTYAYTCTTVVDIRAPVASVAMARLPLALFIPCLLCAPKAQRVSVFLFIVIHVTNCVHSSSTAVI